MPWDESELPDPKDGTRNGFDMVLENHIDMLKAYKYRLCPTKEQKESFLHQFGCSRFVWNWALEAKTKAYATDKSRLTCFDMILKLPTLKDENPWLKDAYSQSLQSQLRSLDSAFTGFFRRVKQGAKEKGYPRFKSRDGRQSVRFPQGAKADFVDGLAVLPKMGGVRARFDRTFDGKVKTVTVSMEPTGKFYVSFLVDDGHALPDKQPIDPAKAIGIDLGLESFLTTSNGDKVANPRFLKQDLDRIRRLSRVKSKRSKGGKNRDKARKRLALAHERARNRRRDFLHKLSTRLIRENQAVCVEDLSVMGMMGNRKLAKSISDAAWREFIEMLRYKSEWQGKHLIEIGRFDPSSKMCSACGSINRGLTLGDRRWDCPSCGVSQDRDHNAATNVLSFGLLKQNLIGKVPLGQREVTPAEITQ